MAKIEILLATHNSGKYLHELVDSILSQSVGEFVLSVRDDGSTDGTVDILRSYNDERINIRPDREPSGSARGNFFRLLLGADADYIMFADADDVWLPDKIERTLKKMQLAEDESGRALPILVHGDLVVVNEDLHVRHESLFKYEKLSPERKSLKNLLAQNNVTGCTVMINRALSALVKSEPEHTLMHDWWLALTASAFGRIEVVYEQLMLYRQHGDNSVGAYDASDPVTALKKLGNSEKVGRIYGEMFLQAACFADTFSDKLTPEQLRICRKYASMRHKGKPGRIATIIKNGFYKNTLVRNLGQFLKI